MQPNLIFKRIAYRRHFTIVTEVKLEERTLETLNLVSTNAQGTSYWILSPEPNFMLMTNPSICQGNIFYVTIANNTNDLLPDKDMGYGTDDNGQRPKLSPR